jgi:hypothetical protein
VSQTVRDAGEEVTGGCHGGSLFLLFLRYYQSDEMMVDENEGTCSTHWRQTLVSKNEENRSIPRLRRRWEDNITDLRIGVCIGFIWPSKLLIAGSCEHGKFHGTVFTSC